jgi:hypothetical protein
VIGDGRGGTIPHTTNDDRMNETMGDPTTIPDHVAENPDGSPARLSFHQVAEALEGAKTVYEHESDNDTEAMYVTAAGQYVRRTGEDADVYLVLRRDDARDVAEGYVDDADLDMIMP